MPGLSIPGNQTKMLRAVTAAYLRTRCKHLCMLIFRVVAYPRLQKVYTLHIAGYRPNNDFNNININVVKIFHCPFLVSVGFCFS